MVGEIMKEEACGSDEFDGWHDILFIVMFLVCKFSAPNKYENINPEMDKGRISCSSNDPSKNDVSKDSFPHPPAIRPQSHHRDVRRPKAVADELKNLRRKRGKKLTWLVVYLPLWKTWKSAGMMTFPIYGKS